jgi:hypothetical protein
MQGRKGGVGRWYNKPSETAIETAMLIRPPVPDPPFNIVRASHVELGIRDLDRARGFYVNCLGRPVRGHPAPKSWFEEGFEFAGVPVREPVLEARPVVAR